MRAHFIANKSESDPGFVGQALEAAGFSIEITHRRALKGVPEGDLLVLLGSGWSVYWTEIADFVALESEIVRNWVDSDRPVLAICYGAQLAASALGGSVARNKTHEIGWTSLESSVPAIASGPWMQWHYDGFTVPDGAIALAHNQVGPQAFRMGSLLGVQFHPEATVDIVSSWASEGGVEELQNAGIDRGELMSRTKLETVHSKQRAFALVNWFLDGMPGT